METKNARIESTHLGMEDHGFFTFYLMLDYGGSGQGAGGYCLDIWNDDENSKGDANQLAKSFLIIKEIMKTVGVEKWEDLKGKHIRVKAEHAKVYEIGHFLKDKWLNFEDFFKDLQK